MNGLRGLAWLLAFQCAGELLSRGLHLPLPGPVLGSGQSSPAAANQVRQGSSGLRNRGTPSRSY